MEKRTLAQVEQEIEETKKALQNVHGTETEVYARIVGYYRAVKHWNNGKRDEFKLRKMFTLNENESYEPASSEKEHASKDVTGSEASAEHTVLGTESVTYEIYTRKTCPNCPPVKAFMEKIDIPGRAIDVDTKEGLAEAAKNGIFASPTVIFYNSQGVETARCHNVEELEAVFSIQKVNA